MSYNSDYYGRLDPAFLAGHRKRAPADWKKIAEKSANETLVRSNLPFTEYLKRVNVRSPVERRRVIDAFHRHGIKEIRGKKVENMVKVVK